MNLGVKKKIKIYFSTDIPGAIKTSIVDAITIRNYNITREVHIAETNTHFGDKLNISDRHNQYKVTVPT